jgi:hypothetical protein
MKLDLIFKRNGILAVPATTDIVARVCENMTFASLAGGH